MGTITDELTDAVRDAIPFVFIENEVASAPLRPAPTDEEIHAAIMVAEISDTPDERFVDAVAWVLHGRPKGRKPAFA